VNLALWVANPGLLPMPSPIGIMPARDSDGYGGGSSRPPEKGNRGGKAWLIVLLVLWLVAGVVTGILAPIASDIPFLIWLLITAVGVLGVCIAAISKT
jgi:hypothetical protein